MSKVKITKKDYNLLKKDLEHIISSGQRSLENAVKEIAVRTHWEAGKRLDSSVGKKTDAAASSIIADLEHDLNLHKSVLYRSLQFFRTYPGGLPRTQEFNSLSWSSHIALLPLSDENERLFYMSRAAEEKWSSRNLRDAISADEYGIKKKEKNAKAQLKRPEPGLYTYECELERVVDGDTIIVRIDLGFDVIKRERIRLRSVDAPPLETPQGEKAKKFVEKKLRGIGNVVLRTHWHDRYGRYVADVLYQRNNEKKENVIRKGRFLNQELLDAGMAEFMA